MTDSGFVHILDLDTSNARAIKSEHLEKFLDVHGGRIKIISEDEYRKLEAKRKKMGKKEWLDQVNGHKPYLDILDPSEIEVQTIEKTIVRNTSHAALSGSSEVRFDNEGRPIFPGTDAPQQPSTETTETRSDSKINDSKTDSSKTDDSKTDDSKTDSSPSGRKSPGRPPKSESK